MATSAALRAAAKMTQRGVTFIQFVGRYFVPAPGWETRDGAALVSTRPMKNRQFPEGHWRPAPSRMGSLSKNWSKWTDANQDEYSGRRNG